jgi:hypothetical protein
MNNQSSDTTPPPPVKLSAEGDDKKRYLVYGPNLGAEMHTFSEALETEKAGLGERQKEDPAPLYAPQSGQPLPPKHPCFDGVPTLPGKIVVQAVPFGKTSLPRDPLSRDLSKDEAAAFAQIWETIQAEAETQAATSAKDRAQAEEYGFTYPVDATQGILLEEAIAWTVGCAGPRKRGYKDVRRFRAWLQRAEYPYLNTGRIVRKGFDLLLQRERERASTYQTAWRRARLDALANQGPKIVNRCLGCGQSLVQPDRGRRRQYCTIKCRQTAYRNRRHE